MSATAVVVGVLVIVGIAALWLTVHAIRRRETPWAAWGTDPGSGGD